MRDKRDIILYCANPNRIPTLRFVLNHSAFRFRATGASTPKMLWEQVHAARNLGCVVLIRDRNEHMVEGFFAAYDKVLDFHINTLQVFPLTPQPWAEVKATHSISTKLRAPMELIAAIQLASRAKRGPKPKSPVLTVVVRNDQYVSEVAA